MCAKFAFFGSERGHDARDKIEHLHAETNKTNKEIISWFYGALNILNSKANALLRINTMLISLLAVFWGAARTAGNPLHITPDQAATAALVLFLVMLSAVFCFMIVRVNWKFLGKVRRVDDAYDFASEIKRLANVVDDRTHYYLFGWVLTLVAMFLPVLLWLHVTPFLWILQLIETHVPAPA